MKAFLSQDNSCHWYVIPSHLRAEWEEWLNIPEDDPKSWEVPVFATAIDGPDSYEFNIPKDSVLEFSILRQSDSKRRRSVRRLRLRECYGDIDELYLSKVLTDLVQGFGYKQTIIKVEKR